MFSCRQSHQNIDILVPPKLPSSDADADKSLQLCHSRYVTQSMSLPAAAGANDSMNQ